MSSLDTPMPLTSSPSTRSQYCSYMSPKQRILCIASIACAALAVFVLFVFAPHIGTFVFSATVAVGSLSSLIATTLFLQSLYHYALKTPIESDLILRSSPAVYRESFGSPADLIAQHINTMPKEKILEWLEYLTQENDPNWSTEAIGDAISKHWDLSVTLLINIYNKTASKTAKALTRHLGDFDASSFISGFIHTFKEGLGESYASEIALVIRNELIDPEIQGWRAEDCIDS